MIETRDSEARLLLQGLAPFIDAGIVLLDAAGEPEYASDTALRLLDCNDLAALRARWAAVRGELSGGAAPARRLAVQYIEAGARSIALIRDLGSLGPTDLALLESSRIGVLNEMHHLFAHDLRAPLNAMQLSLELLGASIADGAGWERHTGVIRDELLRLNKSLSAMLEQGDPLPEKAEACDLGEMLREASRLLKPLARKRQVALELECGEGLALVAARDRLRQAFINLVQECLLATAARGQVSVRATRVASRIVVTLRSGVPGFSEAQQQRLCAVVPSTTWHEGKALYVARRVIDVHGGQVLAESSPATGTRLEISLPAA